MWCERSAWSVSVVELVVWGLVLLGALAWRAASLYRGAP